MRNSNERIALWSDIKANVEERIRENKKRLQACRDGDLLRLLVRIQKDDFERLKTANEVIAFHQRPKTVREVAY